MNFKDRTYLMLSVLTLFSVIVISAGQNFWKIHSNEIKDEKPEDKRIKIVWCTISREEQYKCNNFAMANERDRIRVRDDYFKLECLQAFDKEECMKLLDEEKATLTTLDAGEVFIGGRYNSLVPIAQEVLSDNSRYYYAVAVVNKGKLEHVRSLYDLKGAKACFPSVESFAGWVVPIYTLMTQGGMEIVDCNNHVKSATKYFGPSCAVNCLSNKFNPIGDNSDKLCHLCIGRIPGGWCGSSDPYAGYEGAFRCLLENNGGDIAFLRHTTVPELLSGDLFSSVSKDRFELLCKDGGRSPIDDYLNCNWGRVPTDAVVTTSASSYDLRQKYQLFLEKAAELYNFNRRNQTNYDNYNRDNNNNNYYNDKEPEYDRFGNRINRYKRQNFGNFGRNDPPQYDSDNRYNPYDQNNDYNRNNPTDYDRNNPNNYNPQDPFAQDPHRINPDQYGVNIDPYDDGSYNRNRNNFNFNNSLPPVGPTYDGPRDNDTFYEAFSLFESIPRYGIRANLLFQDSARQIVALNENQQTYSSFLGPAMDIIMGVRECPVHRMTLCVTSDIEKDKCVKMRTAMKAQLLKPEMECYKGHSQINCMQAVRSGIADITVLDASDIYTAGLNFDLVPFISEVYNLNDPEYYVVAVGKESDPDTELTYLRGKYTCHGGINTAAGWVYPLAFLISNGWIRPYGCNSIRAAAEYFTKSCVPGALSTEYNTGVPYDNMCDLCHGTSYKYCRRDASEDYYGHTGAFRCLVEGGGHVAFVTHTTVTENTGGKRAEWWARDNLNDDFELLCPDGTRAEINEYEKCNLGKVKSNAIVTRGGYGYNDTQINAYINLFLYAQTFYGRKTTDEFSFSMFSSPPPYTDLIFQDATTQLKVIPPSQRHFATYLGSDFMRARRIVDCHAGSSVISASMLTLITTSVIAIVIVRS